MSYIKFWQKINYTQNEVVWEFDFLKTNGFEKIPMEKWFNFSQTISESAYKYFLSFFIFLMAFLAMPFSNLIAQESEDERPEPIRSRLSLSTTQYSGDSIELSALLRAKIDGVYQKIDNAKIEFLTIDSEDEILLGENITSTLGTAKIAISAKEIENDEDGYLYLIARFEGNEELKESDDEVSILKAGIVMNPVIEDSVFILKISATAPNADSIFPLADADVSIYVKRMIGRLKVAEETTDENGEIAIEFPSDLPGDDKGNLYITAFIEDFEEYGNLAANGVQSWGKPVSHELKELPRTLWSPNPPIWMVVTFFVLMAAVWGHYAVILSKLFKMRKMGE